MTSPTRKSRAEQDWLRPLFFSSPFLFHDDIPSPIDPTVASLIEARLSDKQAWANHIRRWGTPGRHSEVWALNEALMARKKANIPVCDFSEFAVYNVYSNDSETKKAGEPIVRCPNCRSITGSIMDLSY